MQSEAERLANILKNAMNKSGHFDRNLDYDGDPPPYEGDQFYYEIDANILVRILNYLEKQE